MTSKPNSELSKDWQPWYRVPVVWMVIGIPATSIVVTLSIVWISIVSFDGLIVDDYYRKGLEVNRDLMRDKYAHSINLDGLVTVQQNNLNLVLAADSHETFPEKLQLGFYHPTVSKRDVISTLTQSTPGHYRGLLPNELRFGKWIVAAATGDWRLQGIIFYEGDAQFKLQPVALADEL